ncbi:hypothetical protein AAAC51_28140 [Priestia megaterium]
MSIRQFENINSWRNTNNGEEKSTVSSQKVLFASLVGSTIEFYDFFLYGTVASLVFNKLFFPSNDPFISLLLAYASLGLLFY